MTDKPKLRIPQEAAEAAAASRHDDLGDALKLLKEHGAPILIGLVVGLVLLGGVQYYRMQKRSVTERASEQFVNARSTQDLRQIIDDHGSTPTAPLAMLALASHFYDAGQFEQARQVFSSFMEEHGEHAMKPSAELGVAQCLEALGMHEQAAYNFTLFTTTRPDHYLAPLAVLGKARCLQQQRRFDEARALYEDFVAEHPESSWVGQAESAILFLEKEQRAKPAPAAPGLDITFPPPLAVPPAVVPEVMDPQPVAAPAPAPEE